MAPPDDDGGTKYGGGPPKRPPLSPPAPGSAAPAPTGDTHIGGGPPKRPLAPAASPAAPPEDDGGETMFIDAAPRRAAFSLKRMQPPGHSGAIYLDRPSYRLGRAEGSDIPLYSPTASRQHATLVRDAEGWRLEPAAGKVVLADGELVQESVRLQHEMRLQLGGDELIFSDETATLTPESPDIAAVARADAQQRRRRGRWWWLAPLFVLLAAGVAAVLWWQTHAPAPPAPPADAVVRAWLDQYRAALNARDAAAAARLLELDAEQQATLTSALQAQGDLQVEISAVRLELLDAGRVRATYARKDRFTDPSGQARVQDVTVTQIFRVKSGRAHLDVPMTGGAPSQP